MAVEVLGNIIKNQLVFIILVSGIIIFRTPVTSFLFKIMNKLLRKTSNESLEVLEKKLKTPIKQTISLLGVYFLIGLFSHFFSLYQLSEFIIIVKKIIKIVIILILARGLYDLDDLYKNLFTKVGSKFNLESNKIIIRLVKKVVQVSIIIVTAGIVLGEFYNIGSFIAGLGITGIAIAMAAKDTLSSVIAGISIVVEKPYDIGDYISCNNNRGTVEDITFRNTTIRNLDNELVVIPNIIIVNNPIYNYSKRDSRKVDFVIGLEYGTSKKAMQSFMNDIYILLDEHPKIEDRIMVNFLKYNDSSLDIRVRYYTTDTLLKDYYYVQNEINLNILEIVEKNGVSIAYPSQSIYLSKES